MLDRAVLVVYRALMCVGSFLCHQRAERSPHLFGVQMPLCWRCSGIFIGSAILICYLCARRRLPPFRLSLALALLMPLDVLTAMLSLWPGANVVRFATGALWGIFGTGVTLQLLPRILKSVSLWSPSRGAAKKSMRLQATPRTAN